MKEVCVSCMVKRLAGRCRLDECPDCQPLPKLTEARRDAITWAHMVSTETFQRVMPLECRWYASWPKSWPNKQANDSISTVDVWDQVDALSHQHMVHLNHEIVVAWNIKRPTAGGFTSTFVFRAYHQQKL